MEISLFLSLDIWNYLLVPRTPVFSFLSPEPHLELITQCNLSASQAAKIINGSATLQKVFVSHDLSGKPFQSEDEAAREASNHPYKYSGGMKL